jgi:hypothetical protein
MFRVEANLGIGLQVHANAGELIHAGVGSSGHYSTGLIYGDWESQWQVEDNLPLSLIYSMVNPDKGGLHTLDRSVPGELSRHRCYLLFPGELHDGNLTKAPIHYFDIEVGFVAAVLGLEIGFSLGEFFDWFLGFFTLDIADDDDPGVRKDRTLWNRPVSKEPMIPE